MMRDVAIIGIGMHPWGRFREKSMAEMAVEAISAALKDAKISWRDVESAVSGTYMWVTHYGGMHGTLSGTSMASSTFFTVAAACSGLASRSFGSVLFS